MSLKTISATYYARIEAVKKNVGQTQRLLDVGCSDGYLDLILRSQVREIYGIDINESDIQIARTRNPENHYTTGNLYALPHRDKFFDTVVCIEVLEHLDDDEKAIGELARVLKPGGRLIISVPFFYFPASYDPINYVLRPFNVHLKFGIWGFGHKRLYKEGDLTEKLKTHGIKVIGFEYLSRFLTGIFFNGYLINILQPLVKSDPGNAEQKTKNERRLKRVLELEPAGFLKKFRDIIIAMDKRILKRSKSAINIFCVAEKI